MGKNIAIVRGVVGGCGGVFLLDHCIRLAA